MKRKQINEIILDLDTSDKGPERNPNDEKDELRELGFSEGEIAAFMEADGKIDDYFLLLYKNCPDALQRVEGGFLIYWHEFDDRGKIPYFVHLRMSELVTMNEAAEESDVNVRTIQRWLKEGLRGFKIDGRVLIPYTDLDKFGRERSHDVGEISNK